jgi:hypothetical protein
LRVIHHLKKEEFKMPFDEITKKRIDRIFGTYTETKIPKHLRNQIRLSYNVRGNNITLLEERPAFRSEQWIQHEIAQFSLDGMFWKVYWKDSKNKWHFVDDIMPSEDVEKQLEIVDKDNQGIFWG